MGKFNNRPNTPHKLNDGRIIWESRSVAVVACVFALCDKELYVLSGKRGKGAFDSNGKWNLPCGYLDFDEDGKEAVMREVYEETGLDLSQYLGTHQLVINNLDNPWFVNTQPTENRQNVALRYGCVIKVHKLPELTNEHSELDEVESLEWIHEDFIEDYDWAFEHSKVIKKYLDIIDITHLL